MAKLNEREIFEAALEIKSPAERSAFLEQSCDNDPALAERIHLLFKACEEAGNFLIKPAEGVDTVLMSARDADSVEFSNETPGQRIGRYKLLQQIGEGGMGVVYMAEQEEPVRRRVALKIIKLGMDTRQVVARFEAERQALAMMDHPNIARVLDGGATEAGRPYFVMELVQGIPITEYCEKAKLSTPERLDLFVQVCHAIQSAHQKGIIHRDIKPSNVLITQHNGEPTPKVIDFGVAKATNQKLTEKTLFTNFATMIGTPAYMSPEQAEMSSMDVDTRSDIYSLGVLLYAMLTGTTPFPEQRLRSVGYGEMQRIIAEEEPERPSTRLGTLAQEQKVALSRHLGEDLESLSRLLKGDLDWIIMKCLEKDRRRRYETANGLATDIRRHLQGEPVAARPPTAWYRMQKTWVRNRIVISLGLAVVVALAMGLILSARMYFLERRARVRAISAEEQSRQRQSQLETARQALVASDRQQYRQLYAAEINLARMAWEEGHLARAKELLRNHLPIPGREDLRGFEWRYLWKLCNADSHYTLNKHKAYVQSMALTPKGEEMATACGAGWIHIWNTGSRELQSSIRYGAQEGGIRSITYSSDGASLAAANMDSDGFRVFSRAQPNSYVDLSPVARGEKCIRFLPNTRTVACADSEGTVSVWDPTKTALIARWTGSKTSRPALSITPDGELLASSSGQHEILLRNARTGQILKTLTNHTDIVVWLQFSPDGQRLASSSEDGTVRLWKVATLEEEAILRGNGVRVTSVSFSPDGHKLSSTAMDGVIRIWDVARHSEINKLRGHSTWVNVSAFLPDSRTLVSVADDQMIKVWDTEEATTSEFVTRLPDKTIDLFFSEDGKKLTRILEDETAQVLDLESGRVVSRRNGPFIPAFSDWRGRHHNKTVRIAPDGKWELLGPDLGEPLLRSAQTAQHANLAVFSDDGKHMALFEPGKQISIWDTTKGHLLHKQTAEVPLGWLSLIFLETSDGVFLLEDSPAKSVRFRFLNISTGVLLEGLPPGVKRKELESDGQGRLFWISDSKGIGMPIRESDNDSEVVQLHSYFVMSDRRRLIVGGERDIVVLDLHSGKKIRQFTGHTGWVKALTCSSDEKVLLSASTDGMVKFWDSEAGREIFTLPARLPPFSFTLELSPDASCLAVLDPTQHGRELRLFRAPAIQESAHNLNYSTGR